MDNETTITKPTAEEMAAAERTRCGCCFRPNVDILERGDELLVLADVPGAKSDSIDINFEEGTLEIRAEVPPRHHRTATGGRDDKAATGGRAEEEEFLLHEYGVGDYYRTFQISEAIDAGKISANYADGVLTLHLPKAEALKPRKIAVNAN